MVAGFATERNCCNAGRVRNELDYNNRADFPQRSLTLFFAAKETQEERH